MGLDFNDFVVPRLAFLYPRKTSQLWMSLLKVRSFWSLALTKSKQGLLSVKMNGVNLNLHEATGVTPSVVRLFSGEAL